MPRRRQGRKPRPRVETRPRPRSRVREVLVFIGVAYAVIAAAYAITIPFGQAPDESAHLPYVAYLAEHRQLPVFQPGQGSYEYHQAPLYYAAAVPAYLVGMAVAPERAYVAVRLFGIVLALGVIYLTYLLAREFYAGQPWLAVGVAGLVAFLPMHVALSASVTNDVAAEAPFAAGLWQMVLGARDGWRWRRVLTVGVLCGLATLAKASGLILLPVAWLALVLEARQEGTRRLVVKLLGLTAASLAVCGWWLVRNWARYGDPLAFTAFMQAFASGPRPETLIGQHLSAFNYVRWVVEWTFASFWGVFGNMDVFLPTWGFYMPLAVLTMAATAGAALEAREHACWEPWRRRAAWALLSTLALVGASFVRFNMSLFQAQGRFFFLALPVIAMILVAGWGRLFPRSWRATAYALLWVALMALAAAALPGWILPQM